jgi:hypothetical protein
MSLTSAGGIVADADGNLVDGGKPAPTFCLPEARIARNEE